MGDGLKPFLVTLTTDDDSGRSRDDTGGVGVGERGNRFLLRIPRAFQ